MRTLRELQDMSGRVALVTGAAGHVGQMTYDTLAELGATTVGLDFEASDSNDRVTLAVDLADEAATRAVPAMVVDGTGRLDVIVHCAALVGTSELEGWAVPFESQSLSAWRAAFEVNLTSLFLLVQAALPYLRRSNCASVVTVGSIYGSVGPDLRLYEGTELGNPAAYAASKAGLVQLTRWLATVLAPDVRANAVICGGIERGQPEAFIERYVARTPLRRMAREEDLRGAIAFLASDAGAYVTGQELVVDGGWTAW